MGRQRFYASGELPKDSIHNLRPDYIATDAIKTLLPDCIALVIDIYTNAGDVNIISAIDRDGCDLLSGYALGRDGEMIIATAMLHDVDLWLHINKMPNLQDYTPDAWRCWQWTQTSNVRPLALTSFQYYEKA